MAYEKGKPEPGIKAKLLDDRVRGNNDFIQPALDKDHDFTDAVAANQTGKHKLLHMMEQASPGASAADEGNFAVVDSGTQPEIEFTSEDGNAKILTDGGKINNVFADMGNVAIDEDDMVSDSATHFPTQQSVKAYQDNNTTDDTETDLSGKSWFLDEDDMASDDATKVASQQSINAFVGNRCGQNDVVPNVYNDEESVSFPNGLVMKQGRISRTTDGRVQIVFASPFSTANYIPIVIPETLTLDQVTVAVDAVSRTTSSFYINISGSDELTGVFWRAIGK